MRKDDKRNYSCFYNSTNTPHIVGGTVSRFRFPQPSSSTTLISKPNDDDSVTDDASKTLAKVRKLLVNGKTDVSLSELLTLANIESADYFQALAISSRGNTVVLKQEPCDCNINNYNPAVMLAWQANMDLQYVMND